MKTSGQKCTYRKTTKDAENTDLNHFYTLLPHSKGLLCVDGLNCEQCMCVGVQGVGIRGKFSGLFDPRRILFWPVYVAPQASCETGC